MTFSLFAVVCGVMPGGGRYVSIFRFVYFSDTLGSWSAVWHRPTIDGTPPSPRYGASFTAVSATKALVFGGAVESDTFVNDLHLLDTGELRHLMPFLLPRCNKGGSVGTRGHEVEQSSCHRSPSSGSP